MKPILLAIILFAGLVQADDDPAFTLQSSAFKNGKPIPKEYTCQGKDISPPLQWSNAPKGTKSFVLIIDDPDAPDPKAPKVVWVHWVLYNIPADVDALQEGTAPDAAKEGLNSWEKTGYGGPCPPIGKHRYFHKLYALDTVLPPMEKPTKARVLSAMKGHVLAKTFLMGTYIKSK